MLELFEDKDRNEQRALDEARVADIGDAAIDNDTRIEQLVGVRIGCGGGLCRLLWRCVRNRAHLPHLREVLHEARHEVKEPREFPALLDRDRDAEIPEDNAEDDRDVISDNRDLRK